MKLSELAEQIGAEFKSEDIAVERIASLQEAGPRDISFLSDLRYAEQVAQTRAGAVIVPLDFDGTTDAALLYVTNVDEALEHLLSIFALPLDKPPVGIHPLAFVDPSAQVAEDVAIGASAVIGSNVKVGTGTVISAGCVIGRDVSIGEQCFLWPNVVINQGCSLGNNVIIHPNTTIGADGFGYRFANGIHRKIPHIGIVVIEDDVEIGANCCVDRAKFGRTVVGRGTKVDNLVQIAHNVNIGSHCILVSQTGIAGSSQLGNYVVLAGRCGVSDHVKIGDGVMAGPGTGIASHSEIESGSKIMGAPYRSFTRYYREVSLTQKLPDIDRRLKRLERQKDKSDSPKDHS